MNRIGREEVCKVIEVMTRGMSKDDMITLSHDVYSYIATLSVREDVTLSGFYKNYDGGPSIRAFEDAVSKYIGVPYFKTCTNGTSALHLALMAAGIGRGDRVVVPPLTFSATASAVMMVGAEPVFVDVDQDSYNMDPVALRRLVEVESVKAVIPVHLLGVPCEMNKIMHLASDFNFWVIEDNAQALGASFKNNHTGSWGHLSTNSFQETKVGSTLGEGGGVGCFSQEQGDRIRALRNHGQQYPNPEKGVPANYMCWNMRMTEAQAAMGLAQLYKLNDWNAAQINNRIALRKELEPYGFKFQIGKPAKDCFSTHYIIGTTHEDTDYRVKVIDALHKKGWGQPKPGATIGLGYSQPIYKLPFLKRYRKECMVSEWLCDHFVWWDVHRWMTPEEFQPVMERIVAVVQEV